MTEKTLLVRRRKKAPPPGNDPRHEGAPGGDKPQHPLRMHEVVRELGEPPVGYGIDSAAAKLALEKFLRRDKGSDKPFCTCGEVRGWSFDCQVGVYIHADPKCWKPSKGMYEAALRAGLLGEVPVR